MRNINRDTKPWDAKIIYLWVLIIVSADLKVTVWAHIHWLVSIVLLLPVLIWNLMRKDMKFPTIQLLPSTLFIMMVMFSGLFSRDAAYQVIQAAKLALIIIITLALFLWKQDYSLQGMKAFIVAAYLNFGLLMLGTTVSDVFAGKKTSVRWGTFLNYPGSLAKIGMILLVYSLYILFVRRQLKMLVLFAFSMTIMLYDGSRTALLIGFIALLFVMAIIIVENKKVLKAIITLLLCIPLMFVLFKVVNLGSLGLDHMIGDTRLGKTITNIQMYGMSKGLEESDNSRMVMNNVGLEAIRRNPFIGNGLGSIIIDDSVASLHNTYVQIWANLGIFGLLAYLSIVLNWIFQLRSKFIVVKSGTDVELRAIQYNAIFILFYFGLNGFFHPLSTEFSEWIIFIVAYSIYYNIGRHKGVAT